MECVRHMFIMDMFMLPRKFLVMVRYGVLFESQYVMIKSVTVPFDLWKFFVQQGIQLSLLLSYLALSCHLDVIVCIQSNYSILVWIFLSERRISWQCLHQLPEWKLHQILHLDYFVCSFNKWVGKYVYLSKMVVREITGLVWVANAINAL